MKIVIDTNVVISGVFFGGYPRQVLENLCNSKHQLENQNVKQILKLSELIQTYHCYFQTSMLKY